MHTTKCSSGTVFLHNGDYWGNVMIRKDDGSEIEILFDDMRKLVADHVRKSKINHLENASDDEILGVRSI